MAQLITRLNELPRLGNLYSQALGRQVQTALIRKRPAQQVPDVVYEVAGVHVDQTHLSQYQHLLRAPVSDTLPAGFVHVVGFPLAVAIMARGDFPLPLLGMVHIANTVAYTRPLPLGAELRVRAWAENLSAHARGTQVDLVVEVSGDADASPAWRGVSTYLARGVRISGLPEAPATEREAGEDPTPTAVWKLPGDTGRRYAAVSGDINPIHTSALGAKALGFPRAIAHGMYTASRALAELGPKAGESFMWTVDFAAPVLLPGTVNLAYKPEGDGFAYRGWGKKLNFTGTVTPA